MSRILVLLVIGLLLVACSSRPEELVNDPQPSIETVIERFDPELDRLVASDAKLELLAQGFSWSEGPVWIAESQTLLFSDVPENVIYQWHQTEGLRAWLRPSGCTYADPCPGQGSNGLLLDAAGALVIAQHGDRRMAKLAARLDKPSAAFVTLVDHFGGRRFNSPNDAVFDRLGNLYFTDPPYGLAGGETDPQRELDFQGVYRLSKSGELTLLDDALSRPNGIALALDGSRLYVANSDPTKAIWVAYDMTGDQPRSELFFDATEMVADNEGLPDGLKVSDSGHLFATGPGGVFVFAPDGRWLGRIRTPGPAANCALGNEGRYLYITANRYLLRIPLIAAGLAS